MTFETELRDIVGAEHVLTDPHLAAPYGMDRTGSFSGTPRLVVRPGSTQETAGVIEACARQKVAVVPQGGNTGLVGGAVPEHGAVVVSLTRLRTVEAVDPSSRQVVAGAGATLAAVQSAAAAHDLSFPIDHGARSEATMGGTVATNAGGALAWKYGMTRALVVGVEAVMADGTVVRDMSPLAKDNSGLDLPGLFTGSEGTLAVITATRVRLVPRYPHTATALVGVASLAAAIELFLSGRVAPELEAGEFFSHRCLRLVQEHLDLRAPMSTEHPYYALIEFSAASRARADDALGAAIGDRDDDSVAVAVEPDKRAQLWAYRERQNEALTAAGGGRKFDLAVMPERMHDFMEAVTSALEGLDPEVQIYAFGHLGDGNIHLNALGLPDQRAATEVVYETVDAFDGTVSAEHGVGRLKKDWLHLVRSPAELDVMRAIKVALDPHLLLNPGVLFDVGGALG